MMDKLIRENIERIKSLMVESEGKTEYNFCDRFSGNRQKMYVCSKIGSLKGLLSKSNGLDLRTVIDEQISDLETEIPQDLQDKFIDCAILFILFLSLSSKTFLRLVCLFFYFLRSTKQ